MPAWAGDRAATASDAAGTARAAKPASGATPRGADAGGTTTGAAKPASGARPAPPGGSNRAAAATATGRARAGLARRRVPRLRPPRRGAGAARPTGAARPAARPAASEANGRAAATATATATTGAGDRTTDLARRGAPRF